MKRIWPYLLMIVSATAVAQDHIQSLAAEADKYYALEQYTLAAELYGEVARKDPGNPHLAFKIAECYRHTFKYADAQQYYLNASTQATPPPLSLYYYALMLKFNQAYEESIHAFSDFEQQYGNDQSMGDYLEQAAVEKEGCLLAIQSRAGHTWASMLVPGINSTYNDFAPVVRDPATLVVTSSRINSNRDLVDERYGEAFTDNYYFKKTGNTWVDKTKGNFSITNSRYNDGSGCFNRAGTKYYFTVCGSEGDQCRIFMTSFKDQHWTEPVALNDNVNFKKYDSKQPALSHGGDTLLFVSDRPGGAGKFDIWMSIDAGADAWGPPMNLGNSINTKYNELTPTLVRYQNVIFFSSDGHVGYGGQDLFMARRMSSGEVMVYNLGAPINSNRDDCFISFSEDHLYYSSNRSGGMGGFDIYETGIPSVISFMSRVSLKNRNTARDIRLKSKTENAEYLSLLTARHEEKVEYKNLTYQKKKLVDKMVATRLSNGNIDAKEYGDLTAEEFMLLNGLSEEIYHDRLIRQKFNATLLSRVSMSGEDAEWQISGFLKDSVTQKALPGVSLVLTNELGEVIKVTRTNQEGRFRFSGVASAKQLYIRYHESDQVRPANTKLYDVKTEEEKLLNMVYEENIYFNFNQHLLRPEARKVLDTLAVYLVRNTGVQVEIFAYADEIGSDAYNLVLSQKRGQSVVDYLRSKGVDDTGLAIISKGRQLNDDVTDEMQRQMSRRVEFYLNNVRTPFVTGIKTCFLKSDTDRKTLSHLLDLPERVIMKLNGSEESTFHALQPVRLPSDVNLLGSEIFIGGF